MTKRYEAMTRIIGYDMFRGRLWMHAFAVKDTHPGAVTFQALCHGMKPWIRVAGSGFDSKVTPDEWDAWKNRQPRYAVVDAMDLRNKVTCPSARRRSMPERGDLDRKCPRCGGPGDPYCGLCERDGNLPANYWNTPTITCECIEYEDGSLDISQTCPIHVVTYVSAETLAAMEASPIEPHLPYVRAMRELFGKELP